MTASCIHGYKPGDCLICQTLGSGEPQASPGRTTLTHASPAPARHTDSGSPFPAPARPDAVFTRESNGRHHGHGRVGSLLLAVAALVAIAAVVWIVAGIVLSALHVIELIAVCAGAGWVGYKIGHFRGSRAHRVDK